MNKKQILVCAISPILPTDSGGKVYIASTIFPLKDDYDFHLIVFINNEDDYKIFNKTQEEYKKYFKTVNFVKRPLFLHEMNKREKVVHFYRHVKLGLPLMDISYYSDSMVKKVESLVREYKIDIIELHNLHMSFIKRFFPSIPTVLVSQNIEGDIFPFWEPHIEGRLKKKIWRFLINTSRKNTFDIELGNKFKFEAKTFISLADLDRVIEDKTKSYHLPLTFKTNKLERKDNGSILKIAWVGGFGWYPNKEGVLWFINEILPLLEDTNNLEIHFVGDSPPIELLKLHDGNKIYVHGRVEILDDILECIDLLIVPLLSGGGVRVKIIESMSKGIPVLSTSKGAEGLGVVNGLDIIIQDNYEKFADEIKNLVNSKERLKLLSEKSIEYVKKKHDIDSCINLKKKIYEEISY